MLYDAIVVGAGPAGSVAALHLARAGARTLLLEKAALGRDKPCGGGLTARAYVDLEAPIDDLVEARADSVELLTLDLLAGRSHDLVPYAGAVHASLGPHLRRLSRLARLVYPWPAIYIRALAAMAPCRRYAARVVSEPWHPV